jgi:hypothetical protein
MDAICVLGLHKLDLELSVIGGCGVSGICSMMQVVLEEVRQREKIIKMLARVTLVGWFVCSTARLHSFVELSLSSILMDIVHKYETIPRRPMHNHSFCLVPTTMHKWVIIKIF